MHEQQQLEKSCNMVEREKPNTSCNLTPRILVVQVVAFDGICRVYALRVPDSLVPLLAA